MNAKKAKLIRRHAAAFGLNPRIGKKAFTTSSRDTRHELSQMLKVTNTDDMAGRIK